MNESATLPARILVVDDEDSVRLALRRMLESAGYRVEEAANGRIAMSLCRANPPDLMILDIFMPEQEGIETIQAMRREFPAVKILAISGQNAGIYLRMARLLGAHATLEKPLRMETVLETVRSLLGGCAPQSSRNSSPPA
ncbi:MAG: response regulator [Bryobacteraceae bacterium]